MKYSYKKEKDDLWYVYDPQGQKVEGSYASEDAAKQEVRFMNGE